MKSSAERRVRCLVTGASGPVGSALVRSLLPRGYDVAVLVRPESDLWRIHDVVAQTTVIHGQLAQIEECRRAIMQFRPEIVFHTAWQGVERGCRHDPFQISVNVPATLQLLEVAINAGAQTWIGIGSQAEYGPSDQPLREDMRPGPATTYGLAKLCAGQLTLERCRLASIRGVWVRMLATYGPADDERRLIPYLTRTLASGGTANLSSGTQLWDYLYIDDAAAALTVLAAGQASGVFNLASGSAWTVRQIAEFIRQGVGRGSVEFDSASVSPSLTADISKILAAVDWRPAVTMEDGLIRTMHWYMEQGRQRDLACRGGMA